MALPFIEREVSLGVTPSRIIEGLISAGLSFRRQAMLDVIASLQGRADLPRWARITPPDVAFPLAAHVVNPVNLRNNYQYVVRVDNAPLNVPPHITVGSDIRLSQEEVFGNARQVLTHSDNYPINEAEAMLIDFSLVKASVDVSAPTEGFTAAGGIA